MLNKLVEYIKSSRTELAHATWPTRRETVRLTLIVIGLSLFVAVFLGLLDLLFTYMLERFVL